MKKGKKIILRILTIIFAAFLIFGIAHIIYVQCHREEAVEYLVEKYDFDKKDIVLLDYEGEKFHDDSDLGILFDWYTTPKTWKLRYNKRTFGVSKTEYGFSDDYQLKDIFEWSVDYLKTVDHNVVGIKIDCGKLHDIVTKENIKDFLINDNDSFVIYYKVDTLEQYYTYSKNGFKYTNDNFDNINSQILKKFELIDKNIENKGVYLTTSDLEFSRNSWDNFASYYYDTKIANDKLYQKGIVLWWKFSSDTIGQISTFKDLTGWYNLPIPRNIRVPRLFLCPNTAFYGGIRADEIVPPWLATKPKNRIIFKAFALFWAEAFLHI